MAIISPLVAKGDFYYAEYNGGLRKQAVQNIVFHHYAGEISRERSREAAKWLSETSGTRFVNANYALGTNSKWYCILPEEYRPWTTGGSDPDERSITAEIMNATGAPTWAVNDEQMESLVLFAVDVANRYGWDRVTYTGGENGKDPVRGKQGMLLMHKWYNGSWINGKWYEGTSCPGPFLSARFNWIAEEATKILQKEMSPILKPSPDPIKKDTIHRVQIGAFRERKGAEEWEKKAIEKGFDVWINPGADAWFRVQLGAFEVFKEAQELEAKIKALGWKVFINSEPAIQQKSLTQIATEVLQGKWGNGEDRKQRLIKAGYNYTAVQGRVNEILSGKRKPYSTQKKSVEELADEVLKGLWGNGEDRKRRLEAEGYNFSDVQRAVNNILGIRG